MFTSIGAAEENLQIMLDTGVVAVIRTESSEQLLRVSQAIRVGGVRCVETAMTTPNALRVDEGDVFNTEDYVGEGYEIVTPEAIQMIKLMARTEGIFLAPVYTSKTMTGLQDHIKRGELKTDDTVLFLHTGGNPALFAYVDELDVHELRSHPT